MPVELIELIPPEVKLEARQCKEIVNKITGHSWCRDLDPRARWATLYYEARLNEKTFECIMDDKEQTVMEVDGEEGPEIREVFTQMELEACGMRKLQDIGRLYGVRGVRKRDLILQILQSQTKLVMRSKAEAAIKGM